LPIYAVFVAVLTCAGVAVAYFVPPFQMASGVHQQIENVSDSTSVAD
jgi:hypothetical protein